MTSEMAIGIAHEANAMTIPLSRIMVRIGTLILAGAVCGSAVAATPVGWVNPLIGSRNGGNTFPGATLPFGMLQWSPENTKGQHDRT
ncbi:MAG TPA: hypothetical protein VFP92_00455, partial [Rhodanobacteraceae bacterium]|nr:hypothetical protein [Rhodanobacteraceae bacterium]